MPLQSTRSIRIESRPDGLTIVPPSPDEPFLIPRFPLSQVHWLTHLAGLMLRKHDRCVVVSLMLGMRQWRWVRPQLIPQRCGVDGANWTHNDSDYVHRPADHLLGGTFQSAAVRSLHEALALVPEYDGLHLVTVRGDFRQIYAFVHHGGMTHVLDAMQCIYDDVEEDLNDFDGPMDRI